MASKKWIPGFVALVGVGTLLFGMLQIVRGERSSQWPDTMGKVSSSFVGPVMGTARGEYQAVMLYDYEVAGRRYNSQRIKVVDSFSQQLTALQRFVAQHPRGSAVKVYYDPHDPAFGVLVPGFAGTWEELGTTITGVVMVVCGLLGRALIK
jgi:hypothetical protein